MNNSKEKFPIEREEWADYTAMGGFVDEVLSIPHYAEHPGDDPQRKCRL